MLLLEEEVESEVAKLLTADEATTMNAIKDKVQAGERLSDDDNAFIQDMAPKVCRSAGRVVCMGYYRVP